MLLKLRYRFNGQGARPWFGIGVGVIEFTGPAFPSDPSISRLSITRKLNIGQTTEVGIDIFNFRLSYAYHMAGKIPDDRLRPNAQTTMSNFHRFGVGYLLAL